MSTTTPTYVEITSPTNGTNDADKAVDQLVKDINIMYDTMDDLGISDSETQDLIDKMLVDSNSNNPDSYTSGSQLDMIQVLIQSSNSVAGGLTLISETMNVVTDLTNLITVGQKAFDDMCNNVDNDNFDPTQDEQELQTALNAMNTTQFTVYFSNGSKQTVTGILNLLSNNSLDGNEQDFWGGSPPPLDASSANLLNTSIKEIQDMFGDDWNSDPESSDAIFKDIKKWYEPTDGTSTKDDSSDSATIYETSSEISDVDNSFGQIFSQLDTNTSELSNELSYGMTMYNQELGSIGEIIDSQNSWNAYIVQQSGK